MKIQLIEDARYWWRMWSNQLAVLVGIIAAWGVDNQAVVMGYVNQIQQPWRSVLTFVVMAGLPILVRIWRQPKKGVNP